MNTPQEEWEREFGINVAALTRKTSFGGNNKERTKFGYKTEIDFEGIKSFIRTLLAAREKQVREEYGKKLVKLADDSVGDIQEAYERGKAEMLDIVRENITRFYNDENYQNLVDILEALQKLSEEQHEK